MHVKSDTRRRFALACVILAALSVVGCAAASASRQGSNKVSGITVYAAASLTDVFPKIDSGPKYSFAGSNTLAAQITLGAPADGLGIVGRGARRLGVHQFGRRRRRCGSGRSALRLRAFGCGLGSGGARRG